MIVNDVEWFCAGCGITAIGGAELDYRKHVLRWILPDGWRRGYLAGYIGGYVSLCGGCRDKKRFPTG